MRTPFDHSVAVSVTFRRVSSHLTILLLSVTCGAAIVTTVHLGVVTPGLRNSGAASVKIPKVDAIVLRRHPRAAQFVDFVIAVSLLVFVHIVVCHFLYLSFMAA